MRLDQALVKRGLCSSRQEAKECISLGYVLVDGKVVTKQAKDIEEASLVVVTTKRKFVSRGGLKLEGALLHKYGDESVLRRHLRSKTALDVGSSTGGFTDCLIIYGVQHVTAVDVGTSQLHTTLQNNSQITLYENTDIRDFRSDTTFDIIVSDVSFISLIKILDTILSFGGIGTEYFLLIKPQFEVGLGNTKKGIVKDPTLVTSLLTTYNNTLKARNFSDIDIFPCVIQGGDGNQEYFVYFKK